METNEHLQVHSEGERLTEEAREQGMSEESRASDAADEAYVTASLRGCGRRGAFSMMDNAERSEEDAALTCDKPTNQLHRELAGFHAAKQDARQKSEHAGFFHEALIRQLEENVALEEKAEQLAESSYNAAKAQLQANIIVLMEARHELEVAIKDDICRSERELRAGQAISMGLDQMIAMERRALVEKEPAEEARCEARAAMDHWRKNRNTAEASLRAVELKIADLVKRVEEERAEHAKKLLDCTMARNLALEEKDVAVLQKLSLTEDLTLERGKVAEMVKALEAKSRAIADAESHESRITLTLREEIMAIERAKCAESLELQEQLALEQSTARNLSEENNLLATKLAQEVTAHQKLKQNVEELRSEAQKIGRELSASQEALKSSGDISARLERQMRADTKSKEQSIVKLENVNRTLKAQLESYNERHQHMQQSCYAVNQALGAANEAKLGLEKDLQSQHAGHVEEMKQAWHAAEQARIEKAKAIQEMKSAKENLERKLTEQAATNASLEKEHTAMRGQLTKSQQLSVILEDKIQKHRREFSGRLQEELTLKELAQEQLANSRRNFCALQQKELEARLLLEKECEALKDERSELRKALAKAEKDTSEHTARLVGHLRASDIDARDQRAKCERAEQEVLMWKEESGVIALD